MKKLSFALLGCTVLMCASCQSEEPCCGNMSGALVVEGGIDSGGYIKVLLTSSIVPDADGGTLDDSVIRWGKITVDNGERSVVLTGGPDRNYIPPYTYYSYDMLGEPGKTYALTAEYGGRKVTSVCTMPDPTPIDRLECEAAGTPGLYSVTVCFESPSDCPAYYRICTQLIGEDEHPYPAVLGTVEINTPGIEVSVPAYRGKHFGNSKDFTPLWPEGAVVKVVLERVSRQVYDFWTAYNNEVLFGSSQFVGTSADLPGNINGGFGVWSARGVSSKSIHVGQ